MRYDEQDIARILRELEDEYEERDRRLDLWDALVLRETDRERETGQYLPPPYDKSRTVIKHATGIIADRVQFLAAKVAENKPNIVAHTLVETEGEPTAKRLREARRAELVLNGIYDSHNGRSHDLQQQLAWGAITKGVGWYHGYRSAEAWKTPSRLFFKDPSDEEVERLRRDGITLTQAFSAPPNTEATHAETVESMVARKIALRKSAALEGGPLDGGTLYVIEALPPRKVYAREDTDGLAYVATIEEVPKSHIGDAFGVVEDENGHAVAGRRDGQYRDDTPSWTTGTWKFARVWFRDEYYYYVSGAEGFGGGVIVAAGKHTHGEVPFYPAFATKTDSTDPATKYLPAIYGALAIMPGYNQVMTLLSNASVYNTTPRYILIRQDGTPVVDPETGEFMTFASDTNVGLDPQFISVIEGGGQFQQLKIENIDDLVNLMALYGNILDTTLPSDAALGSSGASEPAWATQLKQAAQDVKIGPLVANHAGALENLMKMIARDIRYSGEKVFVKTAPHRRGRHANVRGLVEVDASEMHTDISVRQDNRSMTERLQMMQIGGELLADFRIDPITYYEEYQGEDDPLGAFQRAIAWRAIAQMLPMLIDRANQRVMGRLDQLTPNEMQSEAQMGALMNQMPAVQASEPAEVAGTRFPGQEMPLAGPAPLDGLATNLGGQRTQGAQNAGR